MSPLKFKTPFIEETLKIRSPPCDARTRKSLLSVMAIAGEALINRKLRHADIYRNIHTGILIFEYINENENKYIFLPVVCKRKPKRGKNKKCK